MTLDLKVEYKRILKKAIRGVRWRGAIFGYGSERVRRYIEKQDREIGSLEMGASEYGEKIYSKANLELDAEFFSLRVRADMARQGIPV